MLVKELIEKLQEYDGDAEVVCYASDWDVTEEITGVVFEKAPEGDSVIINTN